MKELTIRPMGWSEIASELARIWTSGERAYALLACDPWPALITTYSETYHTLYAPELTRHDIDHYDVRAIGTSAEIAKVATY